MMKYRKKPVVVEAMQWTGLNLEEVKDFRKSDYEQMKGGKRDAD